MVWLVLLLVASLIRFSRCNYSHQNRVLSSITTIVRVVSLALLSTLAASLLVVLAFVSALRVAITGSGEWCVDMAESLIGCIGFLSWLPTLPVLFFLAYEAYERCWM